MTERSGTAVARITASAYRIPTDRPEADGTFAWNATTLVVAEIEAGGNRGLGYTYCDACAAPLIRGVLSETLANKDAFDIPACWQSMQRAVRNIGRQGVAACAISAVDAALWDLKAKLLGMPLVRLLGTCRKRVPIYGSGGFITYSNDELRAQLSGWVERDGCRFVKMKIGSEPARDPHRVRAARAAIGECALFVDANGAFSTTQAQRFANECEDTAIGWFEEPVTSDDLVGLRLLREQLHRGIDVAAGEYIFTLDDARRLLEGGAVDVLQADVTRCGGITGFLNIGALCEAHHIDLSGHCAPSLHCHVACAVPRLRHLEWFHDHVRIERMLFDGAPVAADGAISPDWSRPGHGLEFKAADARRFAIRDGRE